MPRKKNKESFDSSEEHKDYVPAVFARDDQEAQVYCELLADHDIHAIIGAEKSPEKTGEEPEEEEDTAAGRGVPVLVPESFLDEASEIIADREDLEGFGDEEDDLDDEDEDDESGFQEEEEEAADPDDEEFDEEELDEDEEFDDEEVDDDLDDEDDEFLDDDEEEDDQDDEDFDDDEDDEEEDEDDEE